MICNSLHMTFVQMLNVLYLYIAVLVIVDSSKCFYITNFTHLHAGGSVNITGCHLLIRSVNDTH